MYILYVYRTYILLSNTNFNIDLNRPHTVAEGFLGLEKFPRYNNERDLLDTLSASKRRTTYLLVAHSRNQTQRSF